MNASQHNLKFYNGGKLIMLKANKAQLEFVNARYGDVNLDYSLGAFYTGESLEITNFEVDDNGRTTIEFEEWRLNSQYALRMREFTRHPRLTQAEIDYLLGKTDDLE